MLRYGKTPAFVLCLRTAFKAARADWLRPFAWGSVGDPGGSSGCESWPFTCSLLPSLLLWLALSDCSPAVALGDGVLARDARMRLCVRATAETARCCSCGV